MNYALFDGRLSKFFVLLAQLFYCRLARLKLRLIFVALRLYYRLQLFRADLLIRKLTLNCWRKLSGFMGRIRQGPAGEWPATTPPNSVSSLPLRQEALLFEVGEVDFD